MLIGVVSDTHNNIKNIKKIINLFNLEGVKTVIHTGDISKARTLELFNTLNCPLVGVFGNNDRSEEGLEEVCKKNGFKFQEPPLTLNLLDKKVIVFHEPDYIEEFLKIEKEVDLVLHGHTHRYREEKLGETIYFNPGESAGSLLGKNAIGIIDIDNLKIKRIFF
tara:strand:- start:1204 stop:1695 length:492 start_codon:yes stop_codon:yes gene_type:complete